MNSHQLLRQIGHLLLAANWPFGDQEAVWRSVAFYPEAPDPTDLQPGQTTVGVALEPWQGDDDAPRAGIQQLGVYFYSATQGSADGSASVVGGKQAAPGRSANRGVAELAAVVHNAVGQLTATQGVAPQVSAAEAAGPSFVDEGNYLTLQRILLECQATAEYSFAAPQVLEHNGSGFTWLGAHCRARYDFVRFNVVSKAGSSPPSAPSDGTSEGTTTADAFTLAAGPGTSYAVFAEYSIRGDTTIDAASPTMRGTWRAF